MPLSEARSQHGTDNGDQDRGFIVWRVHCSLFNEAGR